MATTPKTVRTYPLNSVARDFTIPFEYLARKFVVVTLIGATRRELVLNTDYRFSTATMITTNKAWGPSDNFTLIEIRRLTSASERLVDFADGSILRAYDLNISSVQSLHIAEEARDLTADTISVNNDGNLDARARKIVNLADGTDDGDAVNMRQQRQWAGSALNQAQAAAQSAQAAAQYAQAALDQARSSLGSSQASLAYSQNSERSANNSFNSESNSLNYAKASASSASASAASQDKSRQWATAGDGVQVEPGYYSSLAWANTSKRQAESSAASASASKTDADRAKSEADRAKTEADKLGNFNGLATTIEYTSGSNIGFKGDVSLRGNVLVKSDGDGNVIFQKSDGGQKFRLTADTNGDFALIDDAAGIVRFRVAKGGLMTATYGQNLSGGTNINGAAQFNGNTVFAAPAQFKNGNVQVYAATQAANAHLWLYGADGATRAIVYAGSDNFLRIQAGGNIAATFTNDGGSTFNNINANYITLASGINVAGGSAYTRGGLENYGRVASYRNGVGATASMYANCHYMAQTDDGSAPAYGFHRGGSYALALWLNGSDLHMQASDGSNRALVTNASLMTWLAGSMTADVIGSIATMQNVSGQNLGLNSTLGGGSLRFAAHNNVSTQAGSGSWRSTSWANNGGVSTWCRYA